MIMIDTDILIDYLRGKENAINIIQNSQPIFISVITYLEILAGAADKKELNKLKEELKVFNIYHLTQTISNLSIEIFSEHYLSQNIEIPDSIIAATAIIFNMDFYSKNIKHYKKIKNLKMFKPY